MNGNLSNSSERIVLTSALGQVIHNFTYSDLWYPTTDGDGYSLVIRDDHGALPNWETAPGWKASSAIGGSPGAADALPTATIAGRHVFYNQSKFDGNDAAANAADDAAIATDKVALLPGGTSSFANYTSYNRGLNGIMVDIADLPAGGRAGGERLRVQGRQQRHAAALGRRLAAAPTISMRPGAGVGGSSRVTLIWPSGTGAIKQWLQVTVKANANTGLATPDVFYFGNAVGESGNVPGDYSVSLSDELLARNNPVSIVPGTTVTNKFDFNRDGTVSVIDQLLSRNNITTAVSKLKQITVPPLPPLRPGD